MWSSHHGLPDYMLIRELTQGTFEDFDLLDVADSTNDYLKQYADQGRARIVQARSQTAGRGRGSRRWLSSRDEGLYISFLVYPNWSARLSRLLNVVAVLAVIESLRSLLPPELLVEAKLPNDVLLDKKKVAGVLVELSTLGPEIKWAIVGIGINVFQSEFPGLDRFRLPPTSLQLAGVRVDSMEVVTEQVVGWFADFFRRAQEGEMSELELRFAGELTSPEIEVK